MKRTFRYYRLILLRYDLPAGLSVFLVALPLCLGIALASSAPAYAGLLSGIIGGLVVAPLSGSALSVSGPAAGLTTLVSSSILSLGDYRLFLLAVIVAGFFQVVLGVLKLGAIANYFPSSVIKGMMAGIGILLIAKQIPISLGNDSPDFWTDVFLKIFSDFPPSRPFHYLLNHTSKGAICISGVSLFMLFLLQRPFAKKYISIPAPLIVVIGGIAFYFLFSQTASGFSLRPTQLVDIPTNIFAGASLPDFHRLFSSSEIWKHGLGIGLLASLETLLCVEAIDKLDKRNRITPVNRELVAQGIGNITCGLLGAIPLTAVVVRGAANVDAGARTKLSAITHGFFLLMSVLLFPALLSKIPYASLAVILLAIGYKLTRPKLFVHMWSLGWKQFLPFIITILFILATDLLIGVSIGLLLSVYFIVQSNFKEEYKITQTTHQGIKNYYIKLNTNVTFLNKVSLRKALDEVPEYSVLVIDGSESRFIDYDILEIISEYHQKALDRHIELHLKGINQVNLSAE
jgi:MFS superfamily sulfate permease-like transporter